MSQNVLVQPFRQELYTPEELLGGFKEDQPRSYENTLDFRVYRHFVLTNKNRDPEYLESVVQSLHDNSITNAVNALRQKRKLVAIMGGHDMERGSEPYVKVVEIAKRFTKRGFLVTSGGGPGAMEAAHLGAFFAESSDSEVASAVLHLSSQAQLPQNLNNLVLADGTIDYTLLEKLHAWQKPAFEICRQKKCDASSLGVPTWLYGYEPPTPFATSIAKYFQNSLREDGMLMIAQQGIVYVEGRAGTLQEVFQDAAQNYYHSVASIFSPMVFVGIDFWTCKVRVEATLKGLFTIGNRLPEYNKRVLYTDSVDEAYSFIDAFTPVVS